MSRLFLARHGETVWHHDNRYAGRTDIALSPRGFEQAAMLAEWAREAGLGAVWSSPLVRARETASGAALAARVPLEIDPGLLEIDFGLAEGLTATEMEASFPEERAAFVRDPVAHPLPGAEAPEEAARRGFAAIAAIAGRAESRLSTLIVAHSTLLRLVLCRALDIPLHRYRHVFPHLSNVAITEVEWTPAGVALLSFNLPICGSQA